MDEKKQIEEMAKLACSVFDGNCMGCSFNFFPPCPPKASAERLYAAGYRKQSGWISVDERLPEYGGSILIHTIEDTFRIAWRDNDNCYISGLTLYEPEGVTHWMPLPKPPKGE